MAKKKEQKTNVMRILDQHKVEYNHYDYTDTGAVSGVEVALALNENPSQVFKTLVTKGKTGTNYVFVIPSNKELDLKKAAKTAGEKSIEMLKSKELLPLTGYIHGGCSPIGMKKFFTTFIDNSAQDFPTIIYSGGKVGQQVESTTAGLAQVIKFEFSDLTVDK